MSSRLTPLLLLRHNAGTPQIAVPAHQPVRLIAVFILVLWGLLVTSAPGWASTLLVPESYASIAAALSAAQYGDEISVAPGTYLEHNLSLKDGVALRSRSGPELTTIDASQLGRVILAANVGSQTEISGFTLRGGVSDHGGGIRCSNGSPRILDNIIIYNHASGNYGGGGIFCTDNSDPVIRGNIIAYNTSDWGSAGIYTYDSEDCPVIENNTVVYNSTSLTDVGGGIYLRQGVGIAVRNNILCFNGGRGLSGGANGVVECNDAYGNTVSNYYGIPDPTGSNGNISLDPIFCDAASDNYLLRADSPCAPFSPPNEGCDLIGARPVGCDSPCPVPPVQPPVCYDFNGSDEGLFVYAYPPMPDYPCGAIPVEPGTMTEDDVLDFTFTVSEGSVPNEWGTGSRMGVTTDDTYEHFLGISLVYDNNVCYQVHLTANTTPGLDFTATPGVTYRAQISYDGASAYLQLVDVDAGCVVHTDALAYIPYDFDVFQIGLDYPGQAHCGPTHFWWNEADGRAEFCVDRDTGPYLEGSVDDIHTPGCVTCAPPPPQPDICYSFDLTDEGLYGYAYPPMPDYPCAAIPVAPGIMTTDDALDFTFAVSEGSVPNEWGTGSRMGVTTDETYEHFLGISLVYDDNVCYRVRLAANTTSGLDFIATPGITYRAHITYDGASAQLQLIDVDADCVVFSDALAYVPYDFDVFQIGLDYPGQAHCGPVHFWWNEADGRAEFCVDRDTGPYLEGFVDSIHTPGCMTYPPPPPQPEICYNFDLTDEELFEYAYPPMPDYPCAAIPVTPAIMTADEVLDFTFAVSEGSVPNEWGTGSRMGITTADTYEHFLGISLVYDNNVCYRVHLAANTTPGLDFTASPGVTYRAHITYDGVDAQLQLIDVAADCVVFTDAQPYTPYAFDVLQIGLDYPGQAHCGPTHFWWNEADGRAEFCVDRDTGPYLEGWVDDIHTPDCHIYPPPPPLPEICYSFDLTDEDLFEYAYPPMPDYPCAAIPVDPWTMTVDDVLDFTFSVSEGSVPNEWGTGSRMGVATADTYEHFLGISLVYDNNICYQVHLTANTTPGLDFIATPGVTYRAHITYDGVDAHLQLIDVAADCVVFTDARPYTPYAFDVMQIGLDYPGQAHCGPTHFWWNEADGRAEFCVDRDTGPYLEGWVDHIHTPGCEPPIPIPPQPPVCYDFDLTDEGLVEYAYSPMPDYPCAAIPVTPGVIADGECLDFTFTVTEGQVQSDWGTGTRMGLASFEEYGHFLGIALVYDDYICYRVRLTANTTGGPTYTAQVGVTYRAHIAYEAGTATLTLIDVAADSGVFTDAQPYEPHAFEAMQIGLDYPGQVHCGPTHFWWNETDGRAEFCVDRDTGPYLEGWVDDIHTPGCVWERACFEFDLTDEGLFTYAYPPMPDYPCVAIPVKAGVMADGELVVFEFKIMDGQVPNEWGTGSRIGIASSTDYGPFLGLGVVYDNNLCYQVNFTGNGVGSDTLIPCEVGHTYIAVIHYRDGLARLYLKDGLTGAAVRDTIAYTPEPFDIFQLGLDYPGSAICGTTHFWWNETNGWAEFCVDRDTGPYLHGWVDNIFTPGCRWPQSDVAEASDLARGFALWAAPNPLADGTALRFHLDRPQPVRLAVFDATGRLVRVLMDGDIPAGPHAIRWDGRTQEGQPVGSGVYFARLTAGKLGTDRQIIVLR